VATDKNRLKSTSSEVRNGETTKTKRSGKKAAVRGSLLGFDAKNVSSKDAVRIAGLITIGVTICYAIKTMGAVLITLMGLLGKS